MGYHYRQGIALYELTVGVIEDMNDPGIHGRIEIDPNLTMYYDGAVVTLTAIPDEGYFLRGWYDANDALISVTREFDVVMDSNEVIRARFRIPIEIEVSGGGDALYDAVNIAQNGDTLIVAAGTYNGDIDFRGKEIALVSTNPDDPNIVASTIIDCLNSARAFTFINGEGPQTLIDGFAIVNGGLFGEPGGGIYIGEGSSPTIVNVTISDCNVANAGGGGIYIDANSSPIFRNVTVSNCSTVLGGSGGGVYVDANSTPVFTDCLIINCSTEGFGGALYCNNYSVIQFTDCNFIDNYAAFSGGALYHASFSESSLDGCTFSGNTAVSGGGGAYYNVSCLSNVSDCNFSDNRSAEGAGIHFGENSSTMIAESMFLSNAAESGGALYFDPNCGGTVLQSMLIHNDANEDGGAIYLGDSNDLAVVDCNIAFNRAARGGGLFCVDSADSQIVDCSIRYNEARRFIETTGYFIDANDPNDPNVVVPVDTSDPNFDPTDPNLIVVTFTDANGIAQGGGIYSFAGPNMIADCVISNNVTHTSGGGLYLAGRQNQLINLDNCLVTDNAAGRDGGGISNNWLSDLLVSNCTIARNGAGDVNDPEFSGYGGEVLDSIIWDNLGYSGTQIYVGTGFEPDPRPSIVNVRHSDVMGWELVGNPGVIDSNAVFVDAGCVDVMGWELVGNPGVIDSNAVFVDAGCVCDVNVPGNNNIDDDPLFVGGYYISHISAGQAVDSPAIDEGSVSSVIAGLDSLTTALNGEPDSGKVDMGYHYPIAKSCSMSKVSGATAHSPSIRTLIRATATAAGTITARR